MTCSDLWEATIQQTTPFFLKSGMEWQMSTVPTCMADMKELVEKFTSNVHHYSFLNARWTDRQAANTESHVTHVNQIGLVALEKNVR